MLEEVVQKVNDALVAPAGGSWLQSCLVGVATVVSVLVVLEQYSLWRKTQGLPGPRFFYPFLGNVLHMVFHPFAFWDAQDKYGPLSWNVLVGQLFFFTQDSSLSRQVFNNSSNNTLQIVLNLNGERLMGKNNMAFMQGEAHKNLRKQLLPLFIRKALAKYVNIQENTIREHIKAWLEEQAQKNERGEGPIEVRPLIRDLNLETSQRVFVGPYLTSKTAAEFREFYGTMNDALLALPFNFPGTTLWKGIRARKRIVSLLEECARQSKQRMREGHEPECLLDFWMVDTVKAIQEAEEKGAPAPEHSSDNDVACTVLDFLFASQDASSASLTWACHFLARHKDVLQRVRDEVEHFFKASTQNLTPEMLTSMTYTRQVIKEVLRIRAPATLVPHKALKDFQLKDDNLGIDVTVPKGSLVIPSVFSSSFQGFEDPHRFDPERFNSERQEDRKHSQHYLVFGAGPHRCIGYEYAMLHLTGFVVLFSSLCDFERVETPTSDEIVYGPTIYPGDGALLNISPRLSVA
ncbi:Sterol C-22 desaturase [Balamuthia mandrillaris]